MLTKLEKMKYSKSASKISGFLLDIDRDKVFCQNSINLDGHEKNHT
jgi:hypothetical protein